MTDAEVVEGKVVEKIMENYNTLRIRVCVNGGFVYSRPCSFVYIYSNVDDKTRRPYTHLNADEDMLTFLVKVYEGEGVSKYISKLCVGDRILLSHPLQKIEYIPGCLGSVMMIAGGTGIAPMIQILNAEGLRGGRTRFTLFFCNTTERDIIGMQELDVHRNLLDVVHVISNVTHENEKLVRGQINTAILQRFTEKQKNGRFDFVFVCGTPGMVRDVCGEKAQDKSQGEVGGMLHQLGYDSTNVYKF